MKVQRDFLNAPDKFPQGVFLLFQNAMRRICLPKRLEIMFEQPTDTPQFRDGVQIRMGGNPASEKTPPHVFRQRQSDDFRLLREARFFLGDHSEREREREREREQDVGGIPAAFFRAFFASHAFCLWNARNEAPSIPGIQRASAFWQDSSCVLQLPSCHEEPASCSGQIVGI